MKLKRVIIVRHGDYRDTELGGLDGPLTTLGREKVESLARRLGPLVGEDYKVLSSVAQRARESAMIISNKLKSSFESHDVLWTCVPKHFDHDGIIELIRSRADICEVLVLVSHLEATEDLPVLIGAHILETDRFNHHREACPKGEAYVLDFDPPELFRA